MDTGGFKPKSIRKESGERAEGRRRFFERLTNAGTGKLRIRSVSSLPKRPELHDSIRPRESPEANGDKRPSDMHILATVGRHSEAPGVSTERIKHNKKALQAAELNLRLADERLTAWIKKEQREHHWVARAPRSLSETIIELQDPGLWEAFISGNADDGQAVSDAVRSLVDWVPRAADDQQDYSDSLRLLRKIIKDLRHELKGLEPSGLTREQADRYKETAERIRWEVYGGLASVTTTVALEPLRLNIIFSALLGSITPTAVGLVHELRSRQPWHGTPQQKLKDANGELSNQIDRLADDLRGSFDHRSDDHRHISAQDAYLEARLWIIYATQLADDFREDGHDSYCDVLRKVRTLLQEIDRGGYSNVGKEVKALKKLRDRLGRFDYYFGTP